MPNVANEIKRHNTSILKNSKNDNECNKNVKKCNCRNVEMCPLNGKCRDESFVYQGTLTTNQINEEFNYREFKPRYNTHNLSFKNEKYASATQLSKKFWALKREGKCPRISSWKILRKVEKYKSGQANCNLCLTEKLFIIKFRDKNLLNSRSEIISKCRHKNKYLLKNV